MADTTNTTAAPAATQPERAAFEAWFGEHDTPEMARRALARSSDGKYLFSVASQAWTVWQAARRAPAPAPQGPTDAEIDLLVRAYLGECGPQASRIYSFVRAVLASWGTPAASGEPVARKPLTKEEIMKAEERSYVDGERPVYTTDVWGDEKVEREPTRYFNMFMFARAIEAAHGIKP